MTVSIRLKQTVGGQTVYTTLMEPTTFPANTMLPVNYTNIEGAPGVDSGEVEIINETTGLVLISYPVKLIER